jgi:WD repeat-containing protein 81
MLILCPACYHNRAALESERVSQSLHHWIDLTFGHALRGNAAVASLNVELPRLGPGPLRRRRRPQLFDRPHPRRLPRSTDSGALPWLVRA